MTDLIQKALSIFAALTIFATGCTTSPESGGETSQTSEDTTMTLSQKTFAADGQYVKMLGRTHAEDGILWLAQSASGVEFTMTGTSASVTLAADNMCGQEAKRPRFAAYVNGERVVDEMLSQSMQSLEIFTYDAEQEVTVTLIKLSEAAESTCGIVGIDVTSVGDIAPTAEKALKIEFIGDSITCGYGVDDEDRDHHFATSTEDATKAYAYKTARLLDADYSLVSYSGNGIVSGYTTQGNQVKAQRVPMFYEEFARSAGSYNGYSVSSTPWDFTRFVPDVVVINLGTNDASYTGNDKDLQQEYTDAYVEFLKKVRKDNPDAQIICALGVMGDTLYKAMCAAAENYTAETGDEKISTLHLTAQDGSKNGYAADWHPTAASHDVAAAETAEMIKSVLGM